MNTRALLALLALLALVTVPTFLPAHELRAQVADFTRILDSTRRATKMPAMAAAIVTSDSIVVLEAVGVRRLGDAIVGLTNRLHTDVRARAEVARRHATTPRLVITGIHWLFDPGARPPDDSSQPTRPRTAQTASMAPTLPPRSRPPALGRDLTRTGGGA